MSSPTLSLNRSLRVASLEAASDGRCQHIRSTPGQNLDKSITRHVYKAAHSNRLGILCRQQKRGSQKWPPDGGRLKYGPFPPKTSTTHNSQFENCLITSLIRRVATKFWLGREKGGHHEPSIEGERESHHDFFYTGEGEESHQCLFTRQGRRGVNTNLLLWKGGGESTTNFLLGRGPNFCLAVTGMGGAAWTTTRRKLIVFTREVRPALPSPNWFYLRGDAGTTTSKTGNVYLGAH